MHPQMISIYIYMTSTDIGMHFYTRTRIDKQTQTNSSIIIAVIAAMQSEMRNALCQSQHMVDKDDERERVEVSAALILQNTFTPIYTLPCKGVSEKDINM